MRFVLVFWGFMLSGILLQAQYHDSKQANTVNAELFVEAPYICKKFDSMGNPASIPIAFIVHDALSFSSDVDLVSITVKAKPASANSFDGPVLFNNLSDDEFFSQILLKSSENTSISIQGFDDSAIQRSQSVTFKFTTDYNWYDPELTFETINKKWWYFVYNFPATCFAECGDTIDLEISLDQDWATDDVLYLRIIRTDDDFPTLDNWYRGDTHFHSMFTDNTAELGLPVDISPIMAAHLGLEWTCLTDHSCDYDNYGNSMHENWQLQRNLVLENNQQYDYFKMIHAVEMSVANSDEKTVHCLTYPSPEAPYSMPYPGDGGGDMSSTSVNINMLMDSLQLYGGFAYAAHPFAEGDALGFAVNGGVWNLGHTGFTPNGEPHSFAGTVICNNTAIESDIYTVSDITHFKPALRGGQILNMRNRLSENSSLDNPWDPFHNNSEESFVPVPETDALHYMYRFNQNREVYYFMLQQGLADAENDNAGFRKFFQIAGSDAHGSFNFSNTDFTMGVYGSVNDNAFGKFSTLVYCPDGMGENAENVLDALNKGRAVLSEGPIASISLDNFATNNSLLTGDDAVIGINQADDWILNYQWVSSGLYGDIEYIKLIVGTKDAITETLLDPDDNDIVLTDIINTCLGANYNSGYFFIAAELKTTKEPANEYDHMQGSFYAYTNPIWIQLEDNSFVASASLSGMLLYPNPAIDFITLACDDSDGDVFDVSIYNLSDELVYCENNQRNHTKIHIGNLKNGVYTVKLKSKRSVKKQKLIVLR